MPQGLSKTPAGKRHSRARGRLGCVITTMGVWEVIPRPKDEKTIDRHWVEINKGDSLHMKLNVRT